MPATPCPVCKQGTLRSHCATSKGCTWQVCSYRACAVRYLDLTRRAYVDKASNGGNRHNLEATA